MKDKNELGVRNYPINKINPFMDSLTFKTGTQQKTMARGQIYFKDKSNNETIHETGFFGTRKTVDKDTFTKVFSAGVKMMLELSATSYKVFLYVMSATKINDDTIVFVLSSCQEFTGLKSKTSIFKGLSELLEKQVLARTSEHFVYFINPAIIFNGDRMLIVNEYIKELESKLSEQDLGEVTLGEGVKEIKPKELDLFDKLRYDSRH